MAVLNLIIDKAPTRPKALAKLFPITIITSEVIADKKIRELMKLFEYAGPR